MNLILALENTKLWRADNSVQYQLISQTGTRSTCHSLRPQTTIPAGKISRIPWEILGIVVVGGGNPRRNLGCK